MIKEVKPDSSILSNLGSSFTILPGEDDDSNSGFNKNIGDKGKDNGGEANLTSGLEVKATEKLKGESSGFKLFYLLK